MATRRLLVFLAGSLAIGIGAAWVASDFRPVSPVLQSCQVGQAYAVDVTEGQATFDLRFEKGGRYRLIVANADTQNVESAVTVSAEPVSGVERLPLREVLPVHSAIPTELIARQKSPIFTNSATPFVPQGVPPRMSERIFHLHVTDGPLDDARQYAKVRARVVAEGRFVRVYLDKNTEARQLARGLISEIVRLFDEKIVPVSQKSLGEFRDVDGDGKFAILISPWLGRLQGGKTALGGFVRGSDFQKEIKAPFGNQADLMYLSAGLTPGPHLHALLAHEFAHAISFSERLPTKDRPERYPTEEDWLNEAIAHLAENLHDAGWSNLDYRISRFLDDTDASPLVVPNYYANGLWRDPGCRGATYLFLRWVIDQFGTKVLARLIENPQRGVDNLETATGVSFDDLFRGWTIALATSGQYEASPQGGFHSIDLNQRIGRWGLQGARVTEWKLEDEPLEFSLRATNAKFIDLKAETAGIYRLRIRAPGQPKLQVTVIRLAEDSPILDAAATWQFTESRSQKQSPLLRVSVSSQMKIVRTSVECRQDRHRQSVCFDGSGLSVQKLANGQTLSLQIPARLFPRQGTGKGDWQLKILAEDKKGRKAAAWIKLPPPPDEQDRKPLRFAVRPTGRVL